jgi:hypothetical protein
MLLNMSPPVCNSSDNDICIFIQIYGEDDACFGLAEEVAYDDEYMWWILYLRRGRGEYSI